MPQYSIIADSSSTIKIGLFGGSFDPPHLGHLHVSLEVIKRLNLDKLIWLISKQNPLKQSKAENDFDKRIKLSKELAKHPKIIISDFEFYQKSYYTADIIDRIKLMYPNAELLWIMGADNLIHFHKWHNWQKIIENTKVIIFDRIIPGKMDFYRALGSQASLSYGFCKIFDLSTSGKANGVLESLRVRRLILSSTEIRANYE